MATFAPRAFVRTTFAATALGALSLAASAADHQVVNVYNWSDYIDASVLADFTKETGIKVVYDVFDSNELLETKLLAGSSGYDVVVPSGSFLARQIQAGVFQRLDNSQLPNRKHMWPEIAARTQQYNPDNAYAVNYMWGTTGIGYNMDAVKKRLPNGPLNSWALLFDEKNASKLKDCGIHVLDAPTEIIPAALRYLGHKGNSHNPAEIKEAAALLKKIRPFVQKFHSSEYINALANGDICLAVGWSGDVFQAEARAKEAKNGVSITYIIPKEGALMWFDMMAIPGDAKHVEAAHKFINYIMRPEVIAKASNYVFYANGNLSSQKLLDPAMLEDPAIYPDQSTLKNLYVTTPYPPKVQRVVTRAWTSVKTGQ
ncbi:MAG: extracellular solute-binding protein [Gammaproteobacteria bacterium]|nr:extracellular solute-binding protein [Gammaproteobacteria bacterium]